MFIFGMCMSMVEQFLFVYLLREFHAPTKLLGMTIVVMTASEVPFFYFSAALFSYLSRRVRSSPEEVGRGDEYKKRERQRKREERRKDRDTERRRR